MIDNLYIGIIVITFVLIISYYVYGSPDEATNTDSDIIKAAISAVTEKAAETVKAANDAVTSSNIANDAAKKAIAIANATDNAATFVAADVAIAAASSAKAIADAAVSKATATVADAKAVVTMTSMATVTAKAADAAAISSTTADAAAVKAISASAAAEAASDAADAEAAAAKDTAVKEAATIAAAKAASDAALAKSAADAAIADAAKAKADAAAAATKAANEAAAAKAIMDSILAKATSDAAIVDAAKAKAAAEAIAAKVASDAAAAKVIADAAAAKVIADAAAAKVIADAAAAKVIADAAAAKAIADTAAAKAAADAAAAKAIADTAAAKAIADTAAAKAIADTAAADAAAAKAAADADAAKAAANAAAAKAASDAAAAKAAWALYKVGDSLACKVADPLNNPSGAMYRYMGNGIINWFPSPDAAYALDPNWNKYQTVDCTGMSRGPDTLSGGDGENAVFTCPTGKKLSSGQIIYGTQPNKIRSYEVPPGTSTINVNSITMGGDPDFNVRKRWGATYTCGTDAEVTAAKTDFDAKAAKAAFNAAVFANPTATATPWNEEGRGNSAYLDRHDINCNGKALNGLHLVRKGDGNFHYEYTCEVNGELLPPTDKETPWNDYGGGNTIYMDRHALDCGEGKVLTQLRFGIANNQIQYKYKCASAKNALTCRDLATPLNDDGGGNTIYMDKHAPTCSPNEAMSKLRYTRGPDGRSGQYRYTCCSSGQIVI